MELYNLLILSVNRLIVLWLCIDESDWSVRLGVCVWSAECERDGRSVRMIARNESERVAFGLSSTSIPAKLCDCLGIFQIFMWVCFEWLTDQCAGYVPGKVRVADNIGL